MHAACEMTHQGFGPQAEGVHVNAERFKSLTESVREIALEPARIFEEQAPPVVARIIDEANAKLKSGGLKEIQFPENVAASLEGLFFDGVVENARKSDPDSVNEIVEFARSKKMTIK